MSVEILENELLAPYTGWRIGGPARFFAVARQASDLVELVRWGVARELPLFLLGGGTNILVGDGGFPGLVIRVRATATQVEEKDDQVVLHAEAGAPTAGTARRMAARGFGGLIWAEGLPGTIGGAIYGNAGCYGGDTAGNLLSASVLLPSGEVEEWPVERFRFGYRTSVLKAPPTSDEPLGHQGHQPVVVSARLRLYRADPTILAAEMAQIAAARKSKTPSGSSCGSSFKNPPGTTAGLLLDQAGMKGTHVGGAVVSDKHANYIVNTGGATASDVLRLMDLMRERVRQVHGVELEPEVQRIGDFV